MGIFSDKHENSPEIKLLFHILEQLRSNHEVEVQERKLLAGALIALESINERLTPTLTRARITIMPASIQVGKTATATIQGLDQNGQPFPLDETYTVQYSASAPADVSFGAPNPDGSVVITGVNPDAGDNILASITRPDGVVIQTNADTLTVTAATVSVLTSATLSLKAN